MLARAPSLFVSHGSPMFALEPGVLGPNLQRVGASLAGLRVIVVVSPHWPTSEVRVTGAATLDTIHDFGGFPAPLYALAYPARGHPQLASRIVHMLEAGGFDATIDAARGLDHGAWVPLRYLRPDADVPVLQVSLPRHLNTAGALRLGEILKPLRAEGVLLMGSGSLTHNLHEFRQHVADPEYAQRFAAWVADAVTQGDTESLLEYRQRAPHASRAHPTEEHYLPLLFALGAADAKEGRTLIEGGMTYGVLSMDSFGFGLPPSR